MQHVEQQPGSIQAELGEWSREQMEAEPGSPTRRGKKSGMKAAWLGVGAGLGAVVVPEVVSSLSRTRLRGSERALVMAVGAMATAAAVRAVDGLLFAPKSYAGPSPSRTVRLHASVTINRSPGEVYHFWRSLENLPEFMQHIESVREQGGESSWRARGPLGATLEWQAKIVEDEPEERLVWRSVQGSTLPNYGQVEFREEPGGLGTELHVELAFEPPGGAVGAALTRLVDELPEQWLRNDLRRLKQILETGEVVRSDASIHRGPHPARPPEAADVPALNAAVAS